MYLFSIFFSVSNFEYEIAGIQNVHPENMMEYQQSLKVTIYCSIDFKHFPFDHHTCDLNFGASGNEKYALKLNPPMIDHKNQSVSQDEGLLQG